LRGVRDALKLGIPAMQSTNLSRYFDFDVVVVQTSHRLNIFGYLYLGEVAGDDYETSGNIFYC